MKYYRAVISSVNGLCSPNRTRQKLAVHDDVLHLVIIPHAKHVPLSTLSVPLELHTHEALLSGIDSLCALLQPLVQPSA